MLAANGERDKRHTGFKYIKLVAAARVFLPSRARMLLVCRYGGGEQRDALPQTRGLRVGETATHVLIAKQRTSNIR